MHFFIRTFSNKRLSKETKQRKKLSGMGRVGGGTQRAAQPFPSYPFFHDHHIGNL